MDPHVVCALYVLPKAELQTLIGYLPLGQWLFEVRSGYGEIGETFVSFQLIHPFTAEVQEDRIVVSSTFAGEHSVVIK